MERTLVLIKPDAVQRGYVGEIVTRLERKGLKLVGLKLMRLSDPLLDEHYAHLAQKSFFPELKKFMSSVPVVVTCWEGVDCVAVVRALCGITNAREAAPGTIRGDLAMSVQDNLVHASDTVENALVEIKRFFRDDELLGWAQVLTPYIYSSREAQP